MHFSGNAGMEFFMREGGVEFYEKYLKRVILGGYTNFVIILYLTQ